MMWIEYNINDIQRSWKGIINFYLVTSITLDECDNEIRIYSDNMRAIESFKFFDKNELLIVYFSFIKALKGQSSELQNLGYISIIEQQLRPNTVDYKGHSDFLIFKKKCDKCGQDFHLTPCDINS